MVSEKKQEELHAHSGLAPGLSLFLFIAALCVAFEVAAVLREPQRWIISSRPFMSSLGFQRLAHVISGASPKIWAGLWAVLGMRLSASLIRSRQRTSCELDRLSFLSYWIVAYLGIPMASLVFPSGARLSMLGPALSYVFAPAATGIVLMIQAAFLTVHKRQHPSEPRVLFALMGWAAAGGLMAFTRFHPLPDLFPSSGAGWAVIIVVGGVVTAISLLVGAPKLEDILQKIYRSRLWRPHVPSVLLAGALLAVPLSGLAKLQSGESGRRLNVILISVDTLRADHMGDHGYHFVTTPELDRFGREASVFENCVSTAPYTAPSIWSMMTSKYPSTHKVGAPDGEKIIHNQSTLARILAKHGYRTVAFVSNFVLRRSRRFYQGFDIYDDTLTSPRLASGLPERTAEKTNEYVLNWLDLAGKDNFFLWVHYQDPHGPYLPPARYLSRFPEGGYDDAPGTLSVTSNDGKGGIPRYQYVPGQTHPSYYRRRYDAEIAYADESVGRLMESIKEKGLWDNSIVIFTADHGEAMGEHGYYFAHGQDLTDNLIRIPLIIHIPGIEQVGRIKEQVSIIDIAPTVLAAVGLENEMEAQGMNLMPLIKGETERLKREYVIVEDMKHRVGFRTLKRKYIDGPDGRRMFDLVHDPDESTNIIEDNPEAAERWGRIKADYVKNANHAVNTAPHYDPGDIQKLRSLGYVD